MILQDGITGWRICLIDRGGCVAYECDRGWKLKSFGFVAIISVG